MPNLEHQVNLRTGTAKKSPARSPETSDGRSPRRLLPSLALAALLVAIGGWYLASLEGRIDRIEEKRLAEQEALVEEVGRLIVLPPGETPRIATVVDPSQYANDPLLSQSAVGDKVLVFERAMKAVLYRPSEKKVVDVMGFALPGEASQ